MNLYFLDAGGAGLIYLVLGMIVLFMFLAILFEAIVMIVMKYNTRFGKTILDSLIVNIASLAVGFILMEYGNEFFSGYTVGSYFALYAVTVLVEAGVLYLLNKQKPIGKTFLVSVVMNIGSYLILFAFAGLH
jgi:hypothetical protein